MSRDERALEAGLTDPTLPRVLVAGELEVLGLLPNASNHTFLARARGDDEEMLAVYKPRLGETPLWDFPEGTLCAREVATYVVARTLGWPNVPATVLRDGPYGIGSVQRFVPF
ncbi:MAG TPA: phosphatidylinositol kinase, partial [Actinomycetota bacterium]|nr:phosphatidylinositol kinase [Actinomycetota bacterium]